MITAFYAKNYENSFESYIYWILAVFRQTKLSLITLHNVFFVENQVQIFKQYGQNWQRYTVIGQLLGCYDALIQKFVGPDKISSSLHQEILISINCPWEL